MGRYDLKIYCVDGVTIYTCLGSAQIALRFLETNDHEGSELSLCIDANDEEAGEFIYDSAAVYKRLQEEIKKEASR